MLAIIRGMASSPFYVKGTFQKRLLPWYQKEKRSLPWRQTRDPYKIWVSEIMLQQTQVSTVIPYYKKWIRVFPTVGSLAGAPIARVLKAWEGLGYYRRARMLYRAARHIMEELGGKIPRTAEALQKLPGIGRYSAGAIASIAFEEKASVLDGNVVRVLTRVFAIRKNIGRSSTIKTLWGLADSLLPDRSIGDFNQALMELGATVCFPQEPDCAKCPLSKLCRVHRSGREIFFPVRPPKEKYERLSRYALVLETEDGEVFLQKQPPGHWWAGLWTFPFWDTRQQLLKVAGRKGLGSLGMIRHGVTRFRIDLHVFRKCLRRKKKLSVCGYWIGKVGLKRTALPSPHRKIAGMLFASG